MSTQNTLTIRGVEITGKSFIMRDERPRLSYQTELTEGWTFRLVCVDGKWHGEIWRADTWYEGLRVFPGTTPEAIIADAEDMLRPRNLGSLAPRDVGFDPRASGTPVVLPYRALRLTVHVPTRKSAAGRLVTGTSESVAADLRGSGYRVEVRDDCILA